MRNILLVSRKFVFSNKLKKLFPIYKISCFNPFSVIDFNFQMYFFPLRFSEALLLKVNFKCMKYLYFVSRYFYLLGICLVVLISCLPGVASILETNEAVSKRLKLMLT